MNYSNDTIANFIFEIGVIVPSMCTLAFAAFLGNCYILACIPWIRRKSMNANLRWSLSLAAADAWAAVMIILGLLLNTYLPIVWRITVFHRHLCFLACLEVFRIGGMLTSILHLLALSLNHYASIVDPLKYKLMMTSTRSKVITVVMWVAPVVILLVCFSVIPGQGFQSGNCSNVRFYLELPFRTTIFLFFYGPMVTMLIVYGRILRILYVTRKNMDIIGLDHSESSPNNSTLRRMSQVNNRINTVQSRMKAVTTTLLIVGTFGLGWLPCVIFFVIFCHNCLITELDFRTRFFVNISVNSLIILKLLLNPLIYGMRILEIRFALWAMHRSRCHRMNLLNLHEIPKRFQAVAGHISTTIPTAPSGNGKNKRKETRPRFKSIGDDDRDGKALLDKRNSLHKNGFDTRQRQSIDLCGIKKCNQVVKCKIISSDLNCIN